MRGAYAARQRAQGGQAGAARTYAHLLAQPEFDFGQCHQFFGVAAPLGDAAADRLALLRVAAVLQPIAVAGRRAYPWVPDILRPQHLER
jgi:hypothetical protein